MLKTLALTITSLMFASTVHAGWTKDWFDSSTKSGAGSFQGQQRGYYSGGHFSGRFTMSNDPLLTISMPRIRAGCGGIDIFLGGLSYLDSDYLVQKLQGIIQAAPAVAFDTAMKVLSKELSDTMTNFEAIINNLNSLNMDDCALAKKIGQPVGNAIGEEIAESTNLGVVDQTISSQLGAVRGWYEQTEKQRDNDMKPVQAYTELVEHCSIKLKKIFASGLLLDNIAKEVDLDGYQDIIRGFAGDVEIKEDAEGKTLLGIPVPPCDNNDNDTIDGFVNGLAERKTGLGSDTCEKDQTGGLQSIVETTLTSMAAKMKSSPDAALTATEKSLVDNAPVPVYLMLRDAIMAQNETFTIEVLREVISYAYAWYMVNNMYQYAEQLFKDAERIIKSPTATGVNCDKTAYSSVMESYQSLKVTLKDLRKQARESYFKKTNEMVGHIIFIQSQMEQNKRLMRDVAGDHVENN